MKLKYNDEGCLPQGIYELTLNQVEREFSQNKSMKRQEMFEHYKIHLDEIKKTGCCLNHWIDGSFVTLKENPADIDTLTEFDGIKIDELGMTDEIEDIIYNAPLRTNGACHSFSIFKVPESFGDDYDDYAFSKFKYLYVLFPKIRNSNKLKGFVRLIGDLNDV